MTRRTDCCPRCGNADGINQIKDKDGLFHGICFKCHYVDPVGFEKRKDARYHWNSLPREHSVMTETEHLLGTGQYWTQIPRRKRARWFQERHIAYDPTKLVPLDPKLRTNPTSSVNQKRRKEYKEKVARGEIKPNPKKHKKK